MSDHSLIIKLGLDTADSKKRVSEINKELKSLDKQIKSLDTSTDDFETNMSNMAKKMDLAKTSVTGLSEKLEEQNKQLDKAEKRLESAKKELEDYANSGEKSAKRMKELETKVMSAQTSFNKLQRDVKDTEMALEKANRSLADMEIQFEKMSFDELTKDFKTVSKNVNEAKETIESLESSLTLQNQALKHTESYLKELTNEFEKYKNSADATTDGVKKFTDEIEETQSKIKQLTDEIKDTEQALDTANDEFEKLESIFNKMSFEDTFKKLNEEIKSLDTSDVENGIQNMKAKIDLTKKSINVLTDHLQKQNKELKQAEDIFESLKREMEKYQGTVDDTSNEMQDLKQKLSVAESSFNQLTQEVKTTEKALESATKEVIDLEQEIKQMSFDKLSDNLSDIGDKLGNVASLTAPLSGALVGLGTVSVTAFLDMEGSLVKVKNMLGLTDTEAQKMYDSAKELASKGFADFDEVLNTLSNVKLMMGDLIDDTQLEDFSKGVLSIAQTFDADLNDVLKASNMLITNFGIDGGEALDIIAYGFQNGLDYSGDFLDTLWEYSVQFADMGYSAKEFASILENGMQNGIFNTDKLADAVKEANIRLKEMPEATGEAVKTLGLDIEKIQSDIAKGGDTAQKAMDDVCEAILAIEDPVERNRVGVEIFGTMWEDTGDAIAKSVAGATDDIESLDGSITEMNNNIETMNDGGLAQLKTKMTEAFQVIGEKLCPVFNNLIDVATDAVDWFTDLDESTQKNIVNFGLLLIGITPMVGAFSSLANALSGAVGLFGKMSTILNGANGMSTAVTGVSTAMTGVSTAIGTGGGSTGVIGSLSALASAFAPWLVGGAIVAGIVAGIVIMKNNYDELKEKQLLLAEGYEGDVARMELANSILLDSFSTSYGEAKTDIETFSSEASSLLAEAFANLGAEDGQTAINLDDYNALIARKLDETKTTIETHQQEMQSDLALFNSNYADQTVLGWDVINTITENKGKDMNKHVQTAYDNLINTQKMSAFVGQTITDEAGNEMVYTWEMYYDDLAVAQENFEEESLKAQVGFYNDELFNTKTFVNDVGATTWTHYQEQLDNAEEQKNEMIKTSEEQRDEQLKVIQQLSDEELEILGYTREELNEIAILQHEQVVKEAEGMYHDAVAEYTSMAEDSAKITDSQREYTIKSHKEMKEGCTEEIQDMQTRIDGILNNSAGDFKDYTGKTGKEVGFVAKNIESMSTRVYGALVDMNGNFITSANTVDKTTTSIQNDINSIQGKSVDVTVKFQSINFQAVRQQVESMGSHVYSAGISSYKDYLDGLPIDFGDDYMNDLYGLKDAGIKTISLVNLGMDTISAIAGKDGNSIVNNAVANYYYNNSQSVQEIGFKPIKIPQPQETRDKEITVNINIDQMGVGTSREEVRKLMKMIEQEIRIHGKKW